MVRFGVVAHDAKPYQNLRGKPIISIFIPQILGNGYEVMEQALAGQMFWGLAFLLIFMKILCTSITLGSGGMGGVFAPSLFIGAMLGTAFGSSVHFFSPTNRKCF